MQLVNTIQVLVNMEMNGALVYKVYVSCLASLMKTFILFLDWPPLKPPKIVLMTAS